MVARKLFIVLFICEKVNILSLDCVFSYFGLLETNFYLKTNHMQFTSNKVSGGEEDSRQHMSDCA